MQLVNNQNSLKLSDLRNIRSIYCVGYLESCHCRPDTQVLAILN